MTADWVMTQAERSGAFPTLTSADQGPGRNARWATGPLARDPRAHQEWDGGEHERHDQKCDGVGVKSSRAFASTARRTREARPGSFTRRWDAASPIGGRHPGCRRALLAAPDRPDPRVLHRPVRPRRAGGGASSGRQTPMSRDPQAADSGLFASEFGNRAGTQNQEVSRNSPGTSDRPAAARWSVP